MSHPSPRTRALTAAAVALCVLGSALAVTSGSASAWSDPHPGPVDLDALDLPLPRSVALTGAGAASSPPASAGRHAYLLELTADSTARTFRIAGARGVQARSSARRQLSRVEAAQSAVERRLPGDSTVLYRTHAALAGLAITTSAGADTLASLAGVAKVHPIVPKSPANATATQLHGAPAAWEYAGTGAGQRIAVIDTGIDYTHANFGGPGTVESYRSEQALAATPANSSTLFPSAKVVDGFDLVGDEYDGYNTAVPDGNPLDCYAPGMAMSGHGSHVAGSAAGYGVSSDGSTYDGGYGPGTPFDEMRIAPGMAPEASLLAYRVFGCQGDTLMVSRAIDLALDPDGDGDPSDRADVINLSLGGPYRFTEDADTVAVNRASAAGAVVTVSAGNEGDFQDVGGSPGNAVRALTVANSVDAGAVLDGVEVRLGADEPRLLAASRAATYDWSAGDLAGDVVAAPAENRTGCAPFPEGHGLAGRIVLVDWDDASPACGSADVADNVAAAGAAGFLLHSNAEPIDIGIDGTPAVPGALLVKSAGDAIRAALESDRPVAVEGTEAHAVAHHVQAVTDTLQYASARGIHAEGNLKPDVAAVGTTVWSTAVGTGTGGSTSTGTSMAAPMVAGLAALVRERHPSWSPELVKADIMNTAGQDLFSGPDHTGDRYAPNRVGAGRIMARPAVENTLLAYVQDDPGAVSVGFGPVEVDGPTRLSKTVTVRNTGAEDRSVYADYEAITAVPGVSFRVSPQQVEVPAGGTAEVTVTLTAHGRGYLTKTVDPTTGRWAFSAPFPRETLSDASGRLVLDSGEDRLRVPVHAAPRPVSDLTQADEVVLGDGPAAQAELTLTGADLGNGANGTGDDDASDDIVSLVAGFELAATDPAEPQCATPDQVHCVRLAEERMADIRYVGVTSDPGGPGSEVARGGPTGSAYFAVNTYGAWTVPANRHDVEVLIDVDGDRSPDLINYVVRMGPEDVFATVVYDPAAQAIVGWAPLNGRFGDVDTALYNSDSMILPIGLDVLADYGIDEDNPRIGYGVTTYSSYLGDPIDSAGFDGRTVSLSADLYAPAVTLTGSRSQGGFEVGSPLVVDERGARLTVTRDSASYAADGGQGLLLLHLHNAVGEKAQVVRFASPVAPSPTPTPTATAAPTVVPTPTASPTATPASGSITKVRVRPRNPARRRDFAILARIRLTDGRPATGTVAFKLDGKRIGRAKPLANGRARIRITTDLARGRHLITAKYRPSSGAVTKSKGKRMFWVR